MKYTSVLAAVVLSAAVVSVQTSCRLGAAAVDMFSGDFTVPKLETVSVDGPMEITLTFSKPVRITEALLCLGSGEAGFSAHETASSVYNDIVSSEKYIAVQLPEFSETKQDRGEGPFTVCLVPQERMVTGLCYRLYGTAEDMAGNSLSFLTSVTGYNDRVPVLLISEVRTEYSKPKAEFVELYARTAGNLGGVILSNAGDGQDAAYEFPPCEISAGEFIVLHMRETEENCIDETESPEQSGGAEAFPYARDFWIHGNKARLKKTDVILLGERRNGRLMDALLIAEGKYDMWPKPEYENAARMAYESGVWQDGAGIGAAVPADRTTVTRTLSRQGYLDVPDGDLPAAGKKGWIVTATGGATPGKTNSGKPFTE